MSGRRADAFDQALLHGVDDRALHELIAQVEAMRDSAATVAPSADFRSSLRARLLAEAPAALARPATPRTPRQVVGQRGLRRRLVGVTAAAVVSVGGVGVVASSAHAVPGDLLYGVKRGVEHLELSMQRSDAARGDFQLAQAQERLAEAQYLVGQGAEEQLADTLDDFREQAVAGSRHLFDAAHASRSPEPVRTVSDFASESAEVVSRISEASPGPSVALAMQTIREIAGQADALCVECPPLRLPAASPATAAPATPTATPESSQVSTEDADATSPASPPPSVPSSPTSHPSTPPVVPPTSDLPTDVPVQIPLVSPLVDGLLSGTGLLGLN
ncbi:MAG: DUF5667 domain-containing protein [Aeromicrobium sp.]|uniref:DUF5667 domain-containing protein n=1 Tax=Aeromicrobium sp. TaxID=1871063 RepID=UPI0039E5E693